MLIFAAWMLFILGIGHCIFGFVRFRQPIREAIQDGFFGQFQRVDLRRLALWFTIVGPLVALAGQVAVHALQVGDLELLKVVGLYSLGVSVLGVMTVPKSPFWLGLLLSPVLVAGGYGWLAA